MDSGNVGSVSGRVMASSAILPLCRNNNYQITYKKILKVVKSRKAIAFVIDMSRNDYLPHATGRDWAEDAHSNRSRIRPIYSALCRFISAEVVSVYPRRIRKSFDVLVAHDLSVDHHGRLPPLPWRVKDAEY